MSLIGVPIHNGHYTEAQNHRSPCAETERREIPFPTCTKTPQDKQGSCYVQLQDANSLMPCRLLPWHQRRRGKGVRSVHIYHRFACSKHQSGRSMCPSTCVSRQPSISVVLHGYYLRGSKGPQYSAYTPATVMLIVVDRNAIRERECSALVAKISCATFLPQTPHHKSVRFAHLTNPQQCAWIRIRIRRPDYGPDSIQSSIGIRYTRSPDLGCLLKVTQDRGYSLPLTWVDVGECGQS